MQIARARTFSVHAESGLQDIDGEWASRTGYYDLEVKVVLNAYPVYVLDFNIGLFLHFSRSRHNRRGVTIKAREGQLLTRTRLIGYSSTIQYTRRIIFYG